MKPGTKTAFGVIAASALLAGCSGESKKPQHDIESISLWGAYLDDPTAADRKYKGKLIRVWGNVVSVDRDAIGLQGYYEGVHIPGRITFTRANASQPGVLCEFDRSQRRFFLKASRGETFTVVGHCIGTVKHEDAWQGFIVILEDCRPD